MLSWFRRHAKVLMVVLGSAAMAIFGLGPVFDELSQRGANGGDSRQSEVVATWAGGKVTRVELDNWERGHWQAQRFLLGLEEAATDRKGDQIRSLAAPIPMLRDNGNQDEVDEQLISKFLLSERAKSEGVIVSDGMIDDYILLSSGDVGFSKRDLDDINRNANQNCSLQRVKEHLKFELLAIQMQQYASAGIPMVPNPTEAIELYSRSQEQVECEVLPINVEDYLDKAGDDISASELKKVYEKGKYEFEDPTGENPGFKIGPKLNVQYFKADYQVALTNEMNKITDAQLQAEYERLVSEKSPIVMEPIEVEDDSIEITTPPSGIVAPDDGEATTDTDAPESSEEAPADVTPPPTSDAPAVEPPAGEVPAVEAPAVKAPAVEVPAVEAPAVETPAVETPALDAPATEGSFKITKSKFQFVSTAAPQDAPAVEAAKEVVAQTVPAEGAQVAPVVDKTLGAQAPVEGSTAPVVDETLGTPNVNQKPAVTTPVQTDSEKAPDAPASTQTPATTTPAATTPATTPAATSPANGSAVDAPETAATQQEDNIGGLGDIMEDSPATTEAAAEDNRKPRPLVEVADDVKRSMCQVEARKAMEESLKKASVMVAGHFNLMMQWEEYAKKKGDPPAPLDMKGIADEYGLVFNETGLVDDVEILQDPIGALGVPMTAQYNGRRQQTVVPVGQMLFNNFGQLRSFDAQTVNDMWGSQNSYLFWAEEKVDTRVPEFEECKDKVEKFVKQSKAFELAMADAQEMKKKVNDVRGKTLAEVFGDRAVPTGAFTWFTNFGSSRYGLPSGVKAAGEDFMQTAFSLAKLEAGVAANVSKDVIYVIQATEPSRAMSEAGHDFLANQYFKYKRIPNEAFQNAQRYTRDLSLEFNQALQNEMEFKFVDR